MVRYARLYLLAMLVTTCWAGQARVNRMKIISVRPSPKPRYHALLEQSGLQSYPVPPLLGFTPLVVVVVSDQHSNIDFDFEHRLANRYTGNPLLAPAEQNFVIGLLDTGSQVDMFFEPADARLGIAGRYLSQNTFPVGGTGGTIETQITMPIGIFAGGLAAIGPDGQLDLSKVVGHTNVCGLVGPAIGCDEQEIPAIIGMPFLAFFNAQIRQDVHRRVLIGDKVYVGPDIEFLSDIGLAKVDAIHKIPIQVGGLGPVTTASYFGFPDMDDFFGPIEPMTPTLLSMMSLSLPTGGALFADVGLLQGQPGPLNPIQSARMMVDTGAQTSIISPDVAARLSLPLEPDFTATICGIGGVTNVPGYVIDYVRINALGGPLEFAKVPFLVLDLQGPDGGPLDGILGMNMFWNRNILLQPLLTGSGFIHVSAPVSYAYIDLDQDGAVTLRDFAVLANAWGTSEGQPGYDPACDLFFDAAIDYKDLSAFADSWRTSRRP